MTSESLGDLGHTLKELSTKDSTQGECLSPALLSLSLGNILISCGKEGTAGKLGSKTALFASGVFHTKSAQVPYMPSEDFQVKKEEDAHGQASACSEK